MPGAANAIEVRVLAMRRSGHHAVVNWMIENASGWSCFLNDPHLQGSPYLTCRQSASVLPVSSSPAKRLLWRAERKGYRVKKDILLHNYEDVGVSAFAASDIVERSEELVGRSGKTINAILVRDPFNLFASRMKWFQGQQKTGLVGDPKEWGTLWKDHAKEAVGETEHLQNKLFISYNDWFISGRYREALCERIGLPFTDAGRDTVARHGPTLWGDSFDGLKYDGRATEMNVLERWKRFEHDAAYRSLFRDSELVELSHALFGEVPGTESFVPRVS